MEKEFVPYNEALALKELGFDEPCFGKFYHNHLEIGGSWLNSEFNKDKTDGNIFTSAPTFSQAFRWLYQKLEVEKGIMPLDSESQLLVLKELIEIVKEQK
jgi:hypothetical protein